MPDPKPTYELLKRKDRASVGVLYERYGKKLFGYGRQKWNLREDDNWDLIYKTLYRVLETFGQYKFADEQKFGTFVFTIFINYLRNFYRDRKNLPAEILELDEAFVHSAETEKENSPAIQLLSEELDKLEDWERILLLMRSQDNPYSAIAAYTGKPEEQLKVYYQRLKKKLAEKLAGKIKPFISKP